MSLSDRIDALLPQTQCTRCGFPTCRAYAEAIAGDQAEINQCPPGGEDGVSALAHLLGRAPLLLNPANGLEEAPAMAVIDEDVCIGCTKCIQACPVDAIVGAAKRMHTVVAAECTGCGLCLPPCPVDCIALLPAADAALTRAQILARAAQARGRFDARNARLAQTSAIAQRRPEAASAPLPAPSPPSNLEREGFKSIAAAVDPAVDSGSASPISRSAVLEAIARGKARRAAKGSPAR